MRIVPTTSRSAERTFDSLLECVTYLHSQCPNSKNLDEPVPFLFRGESRLYRSTRATEARLAPELRHALERPRDLILAELSSFFGRRLPAAPDCAANVPGYVRHYGFPSPLLDFTSNPLVAAYFAAKGRHGLIGVLDVDLARQSAAIVDLRHDDMAQRARTQHAFALAGYPEDLKAGGARAALGMRWFRVRVTKHDRRAFREMTYVEDSHFDVAAGLVTSSVYGVVRKLGKLDDEVASFLASRLPPLPQMFSVRGDVFELETPAASGGLYLPCAWRERHRRIWSRDYPDTEADLPWRVLPPTP